MKIVLKILGGIGIAAMLWLVYAAGRTRGMLSPKEYSPAQVQEMCGAIINMEGFTLSGADVLEHGWNEGGMDSRTLCAMRTTPERVRALKAAIQARHGRIWSGWKTTVEHTPADCQGDEYACLRYGQIGAGKRPDWWPAGALPGAEWFSLTEALEGSSPHPHGFNFVISEPEGLVFVERWRT